MLTANTLLSAVRDAQRIPSNYALAKVLGVREKDVSRWNTGANVPNDAMALHLASLARLDPAEVLAAMHAQRCTDDAIASVWRTIAQRAQAAAGLLMAVVLSGFVTYTPDAQARATIEENASALLQSITRQAIHRRGF